MATALRLLPLMIGWFAMNAPSGLGLYWVFNNVLTTISTVTVKKLVEQDELEPEPIVSLASLGLPRQIEPSPSPSLAPAPTPSPSPSPSP